MTKKMLYLLILQKITASNLIVFTNSEMNERTQLVEDVSATLQVVKGREREVSNVKG